MSITDLPQASRDSQGSRWQVPWRRTYEKGSFWSPSQEQFSTVASLSEQRRFNWSRTRHRGLWHRPGAPALWQVKHLPSGTSPALSLLDFAPEESMLTGGRITGHHRAQIPQTPTRGYLLPELASARLVRNGKSGPPAPPPPGRLPWSAVQACANHGEMKDGL